MKKVHLTPQQVLANYQVAKIIEAEVRNQTESLTLNERVVRAIRATHKADMILMYTVLIDQYGLSTENCKDLLKLWSEALHQYNDGKIQLKQMMGHFRLHTGIDLNEYVEENMDYANIKAIDDPDADTDDHSTGRRERSVSEGMGDGN